MKNSKILILYSLFICFSLMMFGIVSAKNTASLLSSLLYLPLIFYFGTQLNHFLSESKKKPAFVRNNYNRKREILPLIPISDEPNEKTANVSDHNRRLFLKLVGSTGLSILLMALFTKKAQAAFFGSAPTGPDVVGIKDSTGNFINPAEKHATDGYQITEIDDPGNNGTAYYGYIKKNGSWYILQATGLSFRYAKGTSNFTDNWANRNTTIVYDYFNVVFAE